MEDMFIDAANSNDNSRFQSLLLGLAHVTEVILDPEVDGYEIYKPLMRQIGRSIGAKYGVLYKIESDYTLKLKYELPPGSSLSPKISETILEYMRTQKVVKDWPIEGCIAIPINPGDYLWGFVITQKTKEPWSDVEIYILYYLCKIIAIIANRAHTARALQESELRYRILLENQPDIVFTMTTDCNFTFGNSICSKLTGYPLSSLLNVNISKFVSPEYMPVIQQNIAKRMAGEEVFPYDIELVNASGIRIPMELHATHLRNSGGQNTEIICVLRDLSERNRLKKELVKSELKYRTYVENAPNVVMLLNTEGFISFVNQKAEIIMECPREQLLNRHFTEFLAPDDCDMVIANFQARLHGTERESPYEIEVISSTSRKIPVEIWPNLLYDAQGNVSGLLCMISDITNVKKTKEKLIYLSEHDILTGIYNRASFQNIVNDLQSNKVSPVGIIICDINGLKLINDTLGHQAGDKMIQTVGNILLKICNTRFYPARIGGDEFAVILPGASQEEMNTFLQTLHHEINIFNQSNDGLFLSLAIGSSMRHNPRHNLDIVIRTADNSMYRSKLFEQKSARNTILRTLTSALTMRDHMTEEHATRLKHLACGFGQRMNLSCEDLDYLTLLAVTHDIGKIGIPDEILFKDGPLDPDEWEIMRSHSEIGYRIAVESRELSGIAEYILYHHEHWNGEGYPMKLKGDQIPLICRILAIIDAHDAMTNDRPYRRAMSPKEAIEQLLADKGIKYDPDILEEYIMYLIELGEDK
jgi:diguanylate cyclase (GGDEF)-like protein/PAS domain S-box-containing protein